MSALRPNAEPTPPRPGRIERAIDGGYEASADDLAPVAAHLRLDPSDPWMVALEASRAQVLMFGNPDRCCVCNTSLDLNWSADVCEHDRAFCSECTFVDGCAECAEMEGAA
ncbi:hypothetical protein [Nocardioides terrigena]|uniref:hypothetical protein n=1 Tax=Nocardioides terrigena TaxID=424797 RepID=UPI00131EEEF4|nr:hypothetical protein [Nocardioides terrigena]